MVLAHHIIFTAYGFWLPNDPRGSWSDFVRSWELFLKGKATKTNERRSVARREHDQQRRREQKKALKHQPVVFTGKQALAISRGFKKAIQESGYEVVACSIMPAHVHLVVMRHDRNAGKMMGHLNARATQALVDANLHPFVHLKDAKCRFPSVWGHRSWKVFLDSNQDIVRAIKYVHENPDKDALPRQTWSFVRGYPPVAPRKRVR